MDSKRKRARQSNVKHDRFEPKLYFKAFWSETEWTVTGEELLEEEEGAILLLNLGVLTDGGNSDKS